MEHMITSNGLTLWCEDFGDPADPAVLLVMGHGGQGTAWPDSFCEALAAGGRRVVRFDNRDVGLSDSVDFATSPYTVGDLAADAIGVLDALGIERAHVIGLSMGGMIGQEMAIEHPDRMLSLTSWMSTPDVLDPVSFDWKSLPGRNAKVVEFFDRVAANPPTTRAERVDVAVGLVEVCAGSATKLDEVALRKWVEAGLDRSEKDGTLNQVLAIARSRERFHLLPGLSLPTLVLHGTDDPVVPFAHGEETARLIPDARFIPLPGVGHEIPMAQEEFLVHVLLTHTCASAP
ncbi:alpha/beta fold hydrolase [Allokutzneria sp. A3M-2-11 16]|uniref:alpha/beta fold hydrolase n=1 Tax=Allokutzneria sp. A3M-2-11 16 TaxID=2962043 RepID=UPI0020B7610C|nr:alpha/beta hydrolase [Allokutzneria sp. A3M-2-11 16]MCP3803842.1 alpha/beta fold hydrolase [Allokutzneria sp. A3M-2-11 16]